MPSTQLGVVRMSTQRWRHYIVYVVQWLLFPVFVTLENEQQPAHQHYLELTSSSCNCLSLSWLHTTHTKGRSFTELQILKNIWSLNKKYLVSFSHSFCVQCTLVDLWKYPRLLLMLHRMLGHSRLVQCLCVRYVIAPICHIAIALFPLFLFIWFVLPGSSGDSVHIVSIAGTREPQVRDQGLVSGCFILWLKIQ